MPTNVLLTASLYTKLVLMDLGTRLHVASNMSSQFSKEFADKQQKIGTTLSVRKPQRFVGTDGLTYNPEAISDTSVSITCNTVSGVHFEFNAFDKTMSLNDAYDLARPAAIALAAKINTKAATYAALNTFNTVGTFGSTPSTLAPYLQAEDQLVELGMPEGTELNAIVNRRMSSALVNGTSALFNNSEIIGEQHSRGRVVNQLGYSFNLDQTIASLTAGTQAGVPKVNGASQGSAGGNNANGSLITNGWTASSAIFNAGDVFTIANVFAVHPQTRVSTGRLQQFIVQSNVSSDGSGNATISIYPAITPVGAGLSDQFANVTAYPATNATIVPVGTAGATSSVGLLMAKEAFAFLSVPFQAPAASGVEQVSQEVDPETGLSITFVRAWDNVNYKHTNRFDCMYGFGRLYPELACRILG